MHMSGGQGKSFINLGSKLRVSIAQQDHGDKYVEFVAQPTDYIQHILLSRTTVNARLNLTFD